MRQCGSPWSTASRWLVLFDLCEPSLLAPLVPARPLSALARPSFHGAELSGPVASVVSSGAPPAGAIAPLRASSVAIWHALLSQAQDTGTLAIVVLRHMRRRLCLVGAARRLKVVVKNHRICTKHAVAPDSYESGGTDRRPIVQEAAIPDLQCCIVDGDKLCANGGRPICTRSPAIMVPPWLTMRGRP